MPGAHSISFFTVSSILILLLLQTHKGSLAPTTQHLKIGVENNTPTLIVTSSEIGITPRNFQKYDDKHHIKKDTLKAFTTMATATTMTPTKLPSVTTTFIPPKWLHKSNQIKSKSKSQKSFYEKKREKTVKEKSTNFHEKSTTTLLPTVILSTRPPEQTSKLENFEVETKKSNLVTMTTPKVAIETTENNEYILKTKTEATMTSTLSTITTTTATPTTQKEKFVLNSTIIPSTTTFGSLPYQKQTKTSTAQTSSTTPSSSASSSSLLQDASETIGTTLTTTMKPLDTTRNSVDIVLGNTATTTTISSITTNNTPAIVANNKAQNINDNMKALPTAFSTESSKKIEKNKPLMKMSSTIAVKSSTTETPVITTEVAKDTTAPITTSTAKPNKVIKIENHNANVDTTSHEPSTTTTATISKDTTTQTPTTTSLTPLVNNEEVENTATAIKLIDLEKHIPISIDELRTKNTQSQVNDDGHDGIKQTKKKQLFYKHFMTDTIDFIDIQTTSTPTPTSTSTTKPIELNGVISTVQHNIEKPTLITPTSTPIHNAYLGPIIMEEHTISVKKPKPHEHEPSIESKLHDGRIVEIIAPTALLEQQETTTVKYMNHDKKPITKEPNIKQHHQQAATVFSTTVFQVQDKISSTTRKPHIVSSVNLKDEKEASKISDIQIEIYDNVMTPMGSMFEIQQKNLNTVLGSTKTPVVYPTTQERFTQYIVDRTESSTPDTILNDNDTKFLGIGKPEPAAIEIHINVSEGITNQNEELEFSYQQTENTDEIINSNQLAIKPLVSAPSLQNEPNNERADDILIVEIIDTGENSTELQSPEKPVFTIRTDTSSNIELKDIKFERNNDELFLADAKPPNLPPPPPPPRVSNIDHDSDTIFYISNTEVKVGESSTKADDTHQAQIRRSRLENQFFPANYVASTHPNTAVGQTTQQKHLYEEDIILSPIRNTADSLKIFRSQGDGVAAPPLDVTYVGESMIEVEQSSGAGIGGSSITTTSIIPSVMLSQTPDVIIQPAILPEMSIGVPVIGELPPQIELKEIDFMPNEANQQHSGENNDIEENLSASNNDLDRLVESSIQYGGDLIDEGADGGGGFDGIEGSYPFGNMAVMRRKGAHKSAADYAHFQLQHSVNNLQKNELSVDVDVESTATKETMSDVSSENSTSTILDGIVAGIAALKSNNNTNEASVNASQNVIVGGEKNVTKKLSLAEQRRLNSERVATKDLITMIIVLILIVVIIALTVFVVYISQDLHIKWNDPPSGVNIPNGDVLACHIGECGSSPKNELPFQSPTRQFTSKPVVNSESIELTSTTNIRIASCLPIPDANSTVKPSNFNSNSNNSNNNTNNNCNSNSLNIVNEKQIVDNLVNSRNKAEDTTTTNEIMQSNLNVCPTNSVPDSSYAGPNGSITKMTLKNNHLIVETEERNDISRNARETKMHYNASEKDGVFVVEVARGIDAKLVNETTVNDVPEPKMNAIESETKKNGTNNKSPTRKYEDEPTVLNSHEQVQIHQPPTELHNSNTERSLHQIDETEEETILSPKPENKTETETNIKIDLNTNTNTGLSQSDLSSTSSNDSNKRYTYGNQELYTIEQAICSNRSPNSMNLNNETLKDVSETKDDDRKSENGKGFEHTPEKTNNNNNNNNNNEGFNEVNENGEIIDNDTSVQYSGEDKKTQEIEEKQQQQQEKEMEMEVEEKKEVEVKVELEVEVDVKEQEQQQEEFDKEKTKQVEAKVTTEIIEAENVPQNTEVDTVLKENEIVVVSDGDVDVDADDNDDAAADDDDACKAQDSMSISEVDCLLESVTLETDTTQKLNIEKIDYPQDVDTDPEYAYDSLMSLPDPPTNEEMTNFSDFNGIEINQLDSLPPPPPPPPPLPPVSSVLLADENINMPDIVAEIKSKSCSQPLAINGNIEYDYNNGHENQLNGHQAQISEQNAVSQLPPPLLEEVNSNSKMLPNSPLTPPESPPSTPPYSNGVLGLNERVCAPVAVDVNVS